MVTEELSGVPAKETFVAKKSATITMLRTDFISELNGSLQISAKYVYNLRCKHNNSLVT